MEYLEMWHVFVTNGTGCRSCQYGYRDALIFDLTGGMIRVCDGKMELPLEEWTEQELVWAASNILKLEGNDRLFTLPGLTLQAMKDCGVPDRKRATVMRKILHGIQDTV